MDGIDELAATVRDARLPSPPMRRRIRLEAGVSLRAGAGALEIHPMTLMRWEAGKTPTRANAVRYRRFLDALQEAVRVG